MDKLSYVQNILTKKKDRKMSVSLQVGEKIFEIGSPLVLHGFFCSVGYHLEPIGWGSKYPALMHELYEGRLEAKSIEKAQKELALIREKLSGFTISEAVFDMDAGPGEPVESEQLNSNAQNLAEFFFTEDKKNFLDLLEKALEAGKKQGEPVMIC